MSNKTEQELIDRKKELEEQLRLVKLENEIKDLEAELKELKKYKGKSMTKKFEELQKICPDPGAHRFPWTLSSSEVVINPSFSTSDNTTSASTVSVMPSTKALNRLEKAKEAATKEVKDHLNKGLEVYGRDNNGVPVWIKPKG